METPAYQSLYRRYRPQRFADVLGQTHVVTALKNAVQGDRVGHAYLFSGPRGTGKTSVARILAKALNCAHVVDGEPDDTCESCQHVREGTSLDVHELDAASNNGVEAMRDLVSRASLGTPGRWKVYIVDEVHMLSTAASNALLKTLEEPPAHVVFVLATTDPQKVLPTIRSRTQHFEFRLLSPELLGDLVHHINSEAQLSVPEDALSHVIRRGRGSARDTLSVLDQVAAAGIVDDETEIIDEITEAICEQDTARAFTALAEACNTGREPQRIGVELLEYLRNGFLAIMAKSLVPLSTDAASRVEEQARRIGTAKIVRSMEVVGRSLQDMRDAPDPRVMLEVALVHLTSTNTDADLAGITARVERLEKQFSTNELQNPTLSPPSAPPGNTDGTAAPIPAPSTASAAGLRSQIRSNTEAQTRQSQNATPPAQRASLGALRNAANRGALKPSSDSAKPSDAGSSSQSDASEGEMPDRDRLVEEWGDHILDKLPQRARSRYRLGVFLDVTSAGARFALPNAVHRDRCEEVRRDVETVLREHFGRRIPLELVVDVAADPGAPPFRTSTPASAASKSTQTNSEDDEIIDLRDTVIDDSLTDQTPADRLLKAFPGAEEIESTTSKPTP